MKLNETDILKLTRYSMEMAIFLKKENYNDKELSKQPVVFATESGYPFTVQLGIKAPARLNAILMEQINNLRSDKSLKLLERNIENLKECSLVNDEQANLMRDYAKVQVESEEATC